MGLAVGHQAWERRGSDPRLQLGGTQAKHAHHQPEAQMLHWAGRSGVKRENGTWGLGPGLGQIGTQELGH